MEAKKNVKVAMEKENSNVVIARKGKGLVLLAMEPGNKDIWDVN